MNYCDFCHREKPTWAFPAESFVDPKLGIEMIEEWAACEECATDIKAEDWDRMAERTLLSGVAMALALTVGHDAAVAEIRRIHQDFNTHQTGTPYPKTDWPEL